MGRHVHIELKPVQWVPAAVPNAPDDMHGQSRPLVPCYPPAAVAVTGHSTIGLVPRAPRAPSTHSGTGADRQRAPQTRSACSERDQLWAKKREVWMEWRGRRADSALGQGSSRKCHLRWRVHASSTGTL